MEATNARNSGFTSCRTTRTYTLNSREDRMLLDSHFKAEVVFTYGNTAIGASETVLDIAKTITAFERIIPQLGMQYALSQAQTALLRLGWGLEDLKRNDSVLKTGLAMLPQSWYLQGEYPAKPRFYFS